MATSSAGDQHFAAHPSTKIGYVSLNVSDISQALEFYESILGFKAMGRQSSAGGDRALLSPTGSDSAYLVELRKAAKKREETHRRKRAGLYHFAILLPERRFLADALALLGEKRKSVHFDGMADHGVSESVYIRDPDANGIEIYRDRPRPEWPLLRQQKGLAAASAGTSRQQIRMVTERLDTQNLLAQATDAGWKGMPAGTTIGHVHLHVRDLGRALQFYSRALGLGLTFALPGAYFFAAGDYHHHVATNTWLGSDDVAAPPGAGATEIVGLNHFAIKVPDEKELVRMAESMSRHGIMAVSQERGSIVVRDPDCITVKIYCE